MRLGGWYSASSFDELDGICQKLDKHGLSVIVAPSSAIEWPNDQCKKYGQRVRDLNIIIGQWGMWENLMTENRELRNQRIKKVQTILTKADMMGVPCVVTHVGTRDPSDHSLAPHSWMYTDQCKVEFCNIVRKILDEVQLNTTHYIVKPWPNTFFFHLNAIREFIDLVDRPHFGVQFDPASMIDCNSFYKTTDLIHSAIDLLEDKILSIVLKDIKWDFHHTSIKWDEVPAGDGVMDFDTLIKRISRLPEDIPCLCEHLSAEKDYAENFRRLHALAGQAGISFKKR